jgi:hypothetical protein
MQGVVAGSTEDERLSPPHGHGDLPEGFFTPPWLIHVRELSDMMDLDIPI